jgi:hypothetical protein
MFFTAKRLELNIREVYAALANTGSIGRGLCRSGWIINMCLSGALLEKIRLD